MRNTDHWFKPKTHGYGATPANWKGWVAIAVLALAICGLSAWLLPTHGTPTNVAELVLWLGGITAITLPFIWLCRVKTDDEWRWQWGKTDDA